MNKVYLAATKGPEHYAVYGIFTDRSEAKKMWDFLRKGLIKQYKELAEDDPMDIYEGMVESLQEEDPEEINNYPHSTPVISEYKVYDEYDPENFDIYIY